MRIARLFFDDQVPKIEVEREILGGRGSIEPVPFNAAQGDFDQLAADLAPFDAVENDYVPMDRELLSRLPRCRVISIAATGWTVIDTEAASDLGMYVCAIGEYCTDEVADHTMSLMMALHRRLPRFNRSTQRDRKWDWTIAPEIERTSELTLGIVGLGKIGRAVAARAKAFKFNVIAYDPYLPPELADKSGVELKSLDELLAESDVISIHMLVDEANQNLIDYARFKQMVRRPFLLNVTRGTALVEADLVRALDEGLIKGAGLDVLTNEDMDLGDHPLLGRENVILTPHAAFYSRTSIYLNYKIAVENIINILEGRPEAANKIVSRPRG